MSSKVSFTIAVFALAISVVTLFTINKTTERKVTFPQDFQLPIKQSIRKYEIKPDPNALAISLSLLQKPQP